jgi:anhydro-N-acetylmuramic acid kinase
LYQHPYFHEKAPKSTGRETFGRVYAEDIIMKAGDLHKQPQDLIATAALLTVQSIVNSCREFNLSRLIVNGGGVKNRFFMTKIKQGLPGVDVHPVSKYGIPADAKEAVCFAVLANETLKGRPNNLPSATGASGPVIMGKICL